MSAGKIIKVNLSRRCYDPWGSHQVSI
jgi:hypothetical protein